MTGRDVDAAQDNTKAPEGDLLPFVHLHVHSEYSLADGAIRVPALAKKAKKMGQSAIALTDSGNLFGAIEFFLKAKAEGVKAIIGCDIWHTSHQATHEWAAEIGAKRPEVDAFSLVLLAKNLAGYHRLIKIVSRGWTDNLSEIPCVRAEWLLPETGNSESEGTLFALSSGHKGEFGWLVKELRRLQGDHCDLNFDPATLDPASPDHRVALALKNFVEAMSQTFGEGNFFVELIDNNLPEQKRLIPDLVAAARWFDLPLVATAKAHYLDAGDAEAHGILVAIKNELKMNQLRGRVRDARFHLLNTEEFNQVYGAWPEAIQNTVRIAEQCNVKFDFGKYYLPKFPLPEGETAAAWLRKLAHERLNERFEEVARRMGPRFDDKVKADYRARLDYELGVIENMGFPGYFLIVQDFINWAKTQDIPVGPGRGSGAGSLVAYALRITDLDPIPYNLVFERFLNPERVSMPDFDIDFCQDRRDEVIEYVRKRYGETNVAQINAFGKMLAKAAVRDIGRVMGVGLGKIDRVSKMIPAKIPDVRVVTLAEAMKIEPRLGQEVERDDEIKGVLRMVERLEGISRHTTVHPAGIVMSDGPMINYVPVYTTPTDGLITQFEMKMAEKVGLVKFDFLGLKTLTVIDHAVKLVRKTKKPDLRIESIPMDDKAVFREISQANTVGIFQLEGMGMRRLLQKLQPSNFNDIIAVVALFRPGPLGAKMDETYIECKHGRQKPDYLLPQLEPVLKETYGVLLYQEQVQKVAAILAKYSLGEADLLRRAMGKKIREEMIAQKDRFVAGAVANGISDEKAREIFDLMEKFADYGFNKSHSAAYGLVSYQTAWLKTHFPEEFMAASMTCDMDKTTKVTRYMDECRRLKIAVLPPDLNRSHLTFDVVGPKVIGFGLSAIKGVSTAAIEPILNERDRGGPFKSLGDLARRVNLARIGKRSIEPLIQVGALDAFGKSRDGLLEVIGDVVKHSDQIHTAKSSGQRSLFDAFGDDDSSSDAPNNTGHMGASVQDRPVWDMPVAERTKTGELPGRPPTPVKWLRQEAKLLGAYVSGHPLVFYQADAARFARVTLDKLHTTARKGQVAVLALFQAVNERITKTGQRMASMRLEDQKFWFEAVMFEKDIPPAWPTAGSPVMVYGTVDETFDKTGVRFKIERIMALEVLRREQVQKIILKLAPGTSGALNGAAMEKLRSILAQHDGDTPVALILPAAKAEVLVKTNLCVDPSDELFQALVSLEEIKVSVDYECKRRQEITPAPQESSDAPPWMDDEPPPLEF